MNVELMERLQYKSEIGRRVWLPSDRKDINPAHSVSYKIREVRFRVDGVQGFGGLPPR